MIYLLQIKVYHISENKKKQECSFSDILICHFPYILILPFTKWADYEITRFELEEADRASHGN